MIDVEAYYERIKSLVKERNITIESLCNMAGINLGSYNSTRHYRRFLRSEVTYNMARALGVSVEYLLTGKGNESDPNYPHWQELSEKKKFMIQTIVKAQESSINFHAAYNSLYMEAQEQHQANDDINLG